MTTHTKALRVVAFREGDVWVAQCLEYDIQAQAADFDTLRRRFTATVSCEARHTREKHGEEFAGIDPAPSYFETMFATVEASLMSDDNVEMRIAA